MITLDDAWRWYETVTRQAKLARRLAAKHWAALPWDDGLGRDPLFRELEADAVVQDSQFVTDHLDDFAVLLLFSVFEATVRESVLAEVRPEIEQLRHPRLKHAAREACEAIEEGSFFRVLDPFKPEGHADLIEEVNQVRRYRNWVAHGRRGDPPGNPPFRVKPALAHDRLKRLLAVIQPPPPAP